RVRAEHHPVDPPRLQPADLANRHGRVGEQVGGGDELLRRVRARLPLQKAFHALLWAVLEVALQFIPGRGEASPAVEVDHPRKVPSSFPASAWKTTRRGLPGSN